MKKWKGDIFFLLAIGALVGGWFYLYPQHSDSPLSPIEAPPELAEENLFSYASPEGLELAYRLYEPQGKVRAVLVFMHDTMLHSGWYAGLGRALAQRGIAVYLPDRRSWGHSAGDRRELSKNKSVLTGDITALISVAESRYPQKEVFVGGHGRGAGLVMRYVAAQRPIAGVILVSPYISEDQPNLDPAGWQKFVTAHPIEAFLARSGLVDWPVWHYHWPKAMTEADPLVETRCSISCQQEVVPDDVNEAYQALMMPLLCLQGADDPLFDPDRAPDLMAHFATPDQQLEILPGVDALSIVDAAAGPVADWLDGQ